MTRNNPFSLNKRIVKLYDNLARDLKSSDCDNILTSLPQFFRIALIENGNNWREFFNTYDLLVMIGVNSDFPSFIPVDSSYDAAITIVPEKTKVNHVEIDFFKNEPIIRSVTQSFSIQDFILSIAYHGSFHSSATKRPELGILYANFIDKHPELCTKIVHDIATCLVQAFAAPREVIEGENNGFNTVQRRQPMCINKGALITFSNGSPASRYNGSYMQFAVRCRPRYGIRVCVEIQLTGEIKEGFIFAYGHRDHGPTLELSYNNGALIAGGRNRADRKCIPIKQIPAFEMHPHKVEVSLYPTGEFTVAINEQLFKKELVGSAFEVQNGKLIIGGDLGAERSGSFLCNCVSIEAIDHNNIVSDLHFSGVRNISTNSGLRIDPIDFHRSALR